MRRILGILLVSIFALALYADEFERAMGLLFTGQTEQGMAMIRGLAEAGDLRAELFLGRVNANPNKILISPDPKEALKWLSRASAQGSGEASAQIGELYERGFGVPKSNAEANKWWELAARQGWDQQELEVWCFNRVDGPQDLTCEPLHDQNGCPAPSEMQALRSAGITGVIRPTGGSARHRLGPKARALVVLDHPLPSEVRLKQPRHTSVIYVQRDDEWLLLPSDASLLDRPILLYPQPDRPRNILAGVKDVDGSITAGGCGAWR